MSDLDAVAQRCFGQLADMVSKAREAGSISPQVRVESHLAYPDFKYGPNGPEPGAISVAIREIPDWSKAADEFLSEFKTSESFKELLDHVEASEKPEGLKAQDFLEGQLREFLVGIIENPSSSSEIAKDTAAMIERQLRGLPIPYGFNLRLAGLVVAGSPLTVTHRDLTIKLRATEKTDLERAIAIPPVGPFYLQFPDAVAEARLSGRPFMEVETHAQRLIAVLRLFAGIPAVIQSTEFLMMPARRSIGFSWANPPQVAWRKGTLRYTNQKALQAFWERLADRLPSSFLTPGPEFAEAVSVAYERFKEAVEGGSSFERSVTSAVMALEALFFKPSGEQAELTYRLSIRVSRFLGFLGKNPTKTREVIELAYDVRSSYVHGGKTSHRDRRKIERLYGSLVTFQTELIDLVRISIVTNLVRHLDKDEFVDMIDDSLIDSAKGSQIEAFVGETRALIGAHPPNQ